jgi:hypothetical protein
MQQRRWFIAAILGICFLAVLGIWQVNRLYAQQLISTSGIVERVQEFVQEGDVLHYTKTLRVRHRATIEEPPDPFHMPLSHFLFRDQVEEVWVTPQIVQSVRGLGPASPQIVLSEFILTPTGHRSYDALTGHASTLEHEQITASQELPQEAKRNVDEVSWIGGLQQSVWEKPAWLVYYLPQQIIPSSLDSSSMAVPLPDLTPFADDLDFTQTQWVMEIDQASGLLVSRQWLALTEPQATVLYIELYSEPKVVPVTTLSFALGDFVSHAARETAGEIASLSTLGSHEIGTLMSGTTVPLPDIAASLPFTVYVPDAIALAKVAGNHVYKNERYYFAPQQKCHLDRPLSFDFTLCAGLGESVWLNYTFWTEKDFSDLKTLDIRQGPSDTVVSMLQKSPPRWVSSTAYPFTIDNQPVQAWFIPALHGNATISALMFTWRGTFLQISGIDLSQEELTSVVESLKPVYGELDNLHRFFVPYLQGG